MTAGDLANQFDMTKPSMSHHFTVLKDADLLTSRREGAADLVWPEHNRSAGSHGLGHGLDR